MELLIEMFRPSINGAFFLTNSDPFPDFFIPQTKKLP